MNPLTDILPPKVRKRAYAVLFLAALVYSAWKAAEGDWTEFTGGLITTLFSALAGSNTDTEPSDDELEPYVGRR